MRKNDKWKFVPKCSRPTLSSTEARSLRTELQKTLKVGIECEYNLPDVKGKCDGSNQNCKCISAYKTADKTDCFMTCRKHGSCEIEKKSSCPTPNMFCLEFEPLCMGCDKFKKNCDTCPKRYDPSSNPNVLRANVTTALRPTKFLGKLGSFGVLDVTTDGSLLGEGGLEVVTVGRRADFKGLYDTCKKVMEVSKANKAFVDERTSIHFHILSGYLGTGKYNPSRPEYGFSHKAQLPSILSQPDGSFELKDLETPVPEIVLANFHQLWRRYENAFVWMSSTGKERNRLTRWSKFRRSVLKYSAVRTTMFEVVREMSGGSDKHRYYSVNYVPVRFNDNGDISRLHLEIRTPDGSLSPVATASMACLGVGILLKAVDISRYGTIDSGEKAYMDRAHAISEALCNNDGDWGGSRHSNTSALDVYIPELIEQSKELLRLVKAYIIDEGPTYDVLTRLAEKPISIRRCEGLGWDAIEEELLPGSTTEEDSLNAIVRLIDLNVITECSCLEEWVKTVSEDQGIPEDQVNQKVAYLINAGAAFWSASLGSLIKR